MGTLKINTNTMKQLNTGAFLIIIATFLTVGIFVTGVVAASKTKAELIQEENIGYKMEQSILKESNDRLRSEKGAYEASLKAVNAEIAENSALWERLQGKIEKNLDYLDEELGKTQQ